MSFFNKFDRTLRIKRGGPSTDGWIRKMWYIYMMQYYSAIKKEQNNAICRNMDATRDSHTECEVSQKEKDK